MKTEYIIIVREDRERFEVFEHEGIWSVFTEKTSAFVGEFSSFEHAVTATETYIKD